MKYLLPIALLLLFLSCRKNPKPQPIVSDPAIGIDTFLVHSRTFRGEYVMFDSTAYWGSTTYPPRYGKEQYQINRVVKIEIDSINEYIIFNYDTFRRQSPTSSRYARRWGPPRYWDVTEDSTTFYFWDSRSGHVQVDTYVKGYRKR